MKKIIAIILTAIMTLSMSIIAYAADEIQIPLDADHVGQGLDEIVIADGAVTADQITLFALRLPEVAALDDTVVIHIKGTTEGDFRTWLLAAPDTRSTFSNQWKASASGFMAPGEFEKYIELTAQDFDGTGATEADAVAFKAPSYDGVLENLKLTYLGVIYGSIADVEAGAVAEAQPYADAAAAALDAAKAASDEAALNAALADAQAAVDALTEKSELGFPGIKDMLDDAKNVVKEINNMISTAAANKVLESIQGDIDAVNNALTAAKNAGNDVDAINSALADAQAAVSRIKEIANANDYNEVAAAYKDAKNAVSEIESALKAAQDAAAKAAAKAAEEAAAKKKQTMTITIIVIVVVAVLAIIIGVFAVLKKKKK